ncbi:MAG: hypothetical protein SFV81_29275 [Pirellulaceae bacterium]|nr:hypothetical protein [Pirellulaceae bacterium]
MKKPRVYLCPSRMSQPDVPARCSSPLVRLSGPRTSSSAEPAAGANTTRLVLDVQTNKIFIAAGLTVGRTLPDATLQNLSVRNKALSEPPSHLADATY